MQRLIALAKELRNPGVAKLWTAAREAEIPVTKAQVRDLLATQGQRQVYRPVPPSKGKTVAEAPEFRYQADLIDYKNNPSKGFSVILILIDVYSRQVWARPSPNKTPLAISRVCLLATTTAADEPPSVDICLRSFINNKNLNNSDFFVWR